MSLACREGGAIEAEADQRQGFRPLDHFTHPHSGARLCVSHHIAGTNVFDLTERTVRHRDLHPWCEAAFFAETGADEAVVRTLCSCLHNCCQTLPHRNSNVQKTLLVHMVAVKAVRDILPKHFVAAADVQPGVFEKVKTPQRVLRVTQRCVRSLGKSHKASAHRVDVAA